VHLGEKDKAHKADDMRLVKDLNGKDTTASQHHIVQYTKNKGKFLAI
jgi:hypothetical protein